MKRLPRLVAAAVAAVLLLAGCAGMRDMLRPPEATITGARLAGFDLNYATLEVDVAVDNPNPIAIDLAGFDYRLRAENRIVLEGRQSRGLELAADERTTVRIPLRVGFGDIAAVIGSLGRRDTVDYDVRLGLDVDVPALGRRHIVLETAGTLPVPHRPRVTLRSLQLRRLDFNGAELRATLGVDNPNAFAVQLDRLDYRLEIDGEAWSTGGSTAPLRIAPDGRGTLTLSLEVDFADLGSGAYALLARGRPIDYRLEATLQASALDAGPGRFELPWSHSGRLDPR